MIDSTLMRERTTPPLQNGLMLVHGNHPEALRELLVGWMKRYPLAPLENEVILVHSNGIAQWLKLALAADDGCGIAGALELSLPASFLWQVYRCVIGAEAVPAESPVDKPRLLWRLLRLVDELDEQPVYAPLRRFLENDDDARKRYQLAERLADVYDQYQVYRADWLAAWAAGADVLIDATGKKQPLAADQRWQPALWRAVLADIGGASEGERALASAGQRGRAAVHAAFLEACAHWPQATRPAGIPRRVLVFGISALPRQSLEVLAALARWSQVLICVHNPCEYYWADIVSDRQLLANAQAQGERRARQARRSGSPAVLSEELLHLHAHPLLAAWGRQGRDFIGLLDKYDSDQARSGYAPRFSEIGQRIDVFSENGGQTLLRQLQDDIRALRPLAETRALWPPVDVARDPSLRFHVAHGAQREVEILHDQLLAAFAADPTLRPRDVVVMVPDIDGYAAHIRAVFGLPERDDARYIPYSLADQKRRSGDPLAQAIETLLALPQSRFAVSELFDLLDVAALRRRFGINEDDLPLLRRWIRGANIRWGLHAEQRASLGLPPQPETPAAPNSWLFGLRRMLLGYAVGAGADAWQGIEPYDEIGGLDAALLGPLVLLVERLEAAWRTLREPATVAVWCERLRALLTDFFDADGEDAGNSDNAAADAYLLQQLEAALDDWREMCDQAAFVGSLPLSVVGDHWLAQLDAGGLAQRFFAGAVTFATLMPMRAIPFRQVCLLGMNDGDYPRARVPMDFDLMGRDSRPGDRSRREDDRYLFLEALLSARDALHISWIGRSINDNTPRPASVLVGQLRDHLAAGWRLAADDTPGDGAALLAALTVEHRLQPFAPDYFAPQAATGPLFTYAREWRPGHAPAADVHRADTAPLPALRREEPLTLGELADFLKAPVRAFFRQRLGVTLTLADPTSDDNEPFVVDALAHWSLQDELIAGVRQLPAGALQVDAFETSDRFDAQQRQTLARIVRRGELPAGAFGEAAAAALSAPLVGLHARYGEALARWPLPVDDQEVRFGAADDDEAIELADWIVGVRSNTGGERGRVVVETSALVRDRHYRGDKLIGHWLTHLAAQLTGVPLTTLVLSVAGDVELAPLSIDEAQAHLAALLDAWRQGMRRPLPLAVKSALVWLKALPPSGAARDATTIATASAAARKVYESGYGSLGEVGNCPYLQRAYPDFAALLRDGTSACTDADADVGVGADAAAAATEFAQLAERLLHPLLQALPVTQRRSAAPRERADGGEQ